MNSVNTNHNSQRRQGGGSTLTAASLIDVIITNAINNPTENRDARDNQRSSPGAASGGRSAMSPSPSANKGAPPPPPPDQPVHPKHRQMGRYNMAQKQDAEQGRPDNRESDGSRQAQGPQPVCLGEYIEAIIHKDYGRKFCLFN